MEELNLVNFDTSKVTSMYSMFQDDIKLKTIYAKSFDKSSLKDNGQDMFLGATSLV
ncbi:BspA family leucine-rich repeat surface protein [bacterium]|nr:BspA family leucine-rich repeat surface protein [bacterium]